VQGGEKFGSLLAFFGAKNINVGKKDFRRLG
jgi:hypothetical protein